MIKINLLGDALAQAVGKKPEVEAEQVYQGEGTGRVSVPIAGILVGLFFAAIGGVYYLMLNVKINEAQAKKVELQRKKQELEPYMKQEEKFRKLKDALERQKGVMEGLQLTQHLPVNFLERLANCLPDDVWFSRITQKGTKITLEGESSSFEAINAFRNNLSSMKEWFDNVTFPSDRTAEKKGNVITFTLVFDLKASAVKLPPKKSA